MRKTLVSLIALSAGLTTVAADIAQAQDAAPMAAPAAAPEAAPMAPPAAPGGPDGAAAAAPAAAGPAPAPAAAGPPPPPPPAPLPTSGNGLAVLNLIRQVCEPLSMDPKAKLDKIAKDAGFKQIKANKDNRDTLPFGGWQGPFGSGAPYSVTFVGQSPANQQVCEFILETQKDDAQILADAITAWTNRHTPFMPLRRNDMVPVNGVNLRRFTWEGLDPAKVYSLNMNVESPVSGAPAGGERIRLRYQVRAR